MNRQLKQPGTDGVIWNSKKACNSAKILHFLWLNQADKSRIAWPAFSTHAWQAHPRHSPQMFANPQSHKWHKWQLIHKPLSFALTYDFSFPLSFLSFLSHTHLKRSQILSLVFRHRLCLNTFMGILVIHWIALKRQLIVVNSVRDWSVFLSMYIYVRQGGGSCPPVLMYKLMYISCLLTVTHQYVTYWKYKQWDTYPL